jgi:predicted lysophospholipase L1 biosynthesis ABC-type transport system permease subunit
LCQCVIIVPALTIHQGRRDIAITRALGATRADVFRQITVEAAALGTLAGLLPAAIAYRLPVADTLAKE